MKQEKPRRIALFQIAKNLFSQLQFSQESALPSDALRRALVDNFLDQQRFQLGFMDDAAECFENILMRIHLHIASSEAEDICNARHCVPHQKFAMTLVEQSICRICGATSEPLPFTQMVHYVSSSALSSQARQTLPTSRNSRDLFGQLLRRACGMEDIRECPSSCGAKIKICRTLMNCPEIVSIGIVWDSERPSLEHIMDVFSSVGVSLKLNDVFHNIVDSCWGISTIHNLVGVVTYYGKHYSTFFFHTKLKVWIHFDDATIKEIGPKWEQVVDKCRRGRYQPLLLLYAAPCDTPVNTENAPKALTTFLEGGEMKSLNSTSLRNSEESNTLRRSITPNPEKSSINNTIRRAITPNPGNPPLAYTQRGIYNDYQNLTDIQNNIFVNQSTDVIDSDVDSKYISRQTVENVMHQQKKQIQLTRSLSAGSSPHDNINIPEHLNIPRRRDSGNWSGDRNSASSSSSTTMDNPYLYIVNKMQKNSGISKSPTSKSGELSSSSSGHYDAGYDSYSLSSTDSLPLQQSLKHNLQLAQIPEGYQQISSDDCERLWMETDALIGKAQVAEKDGDLGTAVILCTAASSKAREAMNVPYSNSNTIDLAQKKHNFCVMRMSYLQKKIKQEQAIANTDKEEKIENRHSRENGKSGQHSRQSSRDNGSHLKPSNREILVNMPVVIDKPVTKSIEIYATLPKKKTLRDKITTVNVIEDEEYMLYDRPTQRIGLFGRSRHYEEEKKDKKRARSEERNKNVSKEFSIVPSKSIPKILKIEKLKEISEFPNSLKTEQINSTCLGDQKQGKKQHKIRRKLLMGGLIKRKNRSMPDLRENQDSQSSRSSEGCINILPKHSVDDSTVGLKDHVISGTLSGYLSEGHLEFTGINSSGSSSNPNLKRSRLMRKSFHGSVSKALHVAKVPPPPPLRTTSQLSKSNLLNEVRHNEHQTEKLLYPLSNEQNISKQTQAENNTYWNHTSAKLPLQMNCSDYSSELHSLSFISVYSLDKNPNKISPSMPQNNCNSKPRIEDDVVQYANGIFYEPTFVITRADIHSEQTPVKEQSNSDLPPYPDNGIVLHSKQPSEEFPPPPYPLIPSVSHSRQGSEDFPPPPSPIENNNQIQINESMNPQNLQSQPQQEFESQQITSLLSQLKLKREQMFMSEAVEKQMRESLVDESEKWQNETWLKELQVKQAERQIKKQETDDQDILKIRLNSIPQGLSTTIARKTSDFMMNSIVNTNTGRDVTDCSRTLISTVKNIAAKFEQKAEDAKLPTHVFSNSPNIMQNSQNSEESKSITMLMDNFIITNKVENDYIDTVVNSATESTSSQNTPEVSVVSNISKKNDSGLNAAILSMSLTLPHENGLPIDCPENDISEIAMQNTIQNTTILPCEDDIAPRKMKKRIGKKKSVSFCDQVVLVATAEDDEIDSCIPNPILERVLRSAMNKPETAQVLREIRSLQQAELNREMSISLKFQQHTLPLKNEADSMPATPFQDQLRSINPVVEIVKPNFTKYNSSEEIIQGNKKLYPCGIDNEDIEKETFSTTPNNISRITSIRTSPLFQQQTRYIQNNYPKSHQKSLRQSQNIHPPIQTLYQRNQSNPPSQIQQPANLYQTSIEGQQHVQNVFQPQIHCSKNVHPSYYQLEQQNNQMNRQLLSPQQQQQQNSTNQRLQEQTANPITVQQQQNIMHQRRQSESSSPITVQPQQQSLSFLNGQLTSSYAQYMLQNSQYSYQGQPYQLVSQQNKTQHLPYYQVTPNSVGNYQHSSLHQSLQKGVAIAYQQKVENYLKQAQKIEQQQVMHLQTQVYSTSQTPLNIKYSTHQHLQQTKQIKQMQEQQMHVVKENMKKSPIINQCVSTGRKLPKPVISKVTPCHLCRKKQVCESAIYCSDCDFYMSRFRPKN